MEEFSSVTFRRHLRKNMPKAEVVLWTNLRGRRLCGIRFRRQHPIGPFLADFACLKHRLVIELDGSTHYSAEARAYDLRRTAYLKKLGWRELRFDNDAVLKNLEGVLGMIANELGSAS